MKINDGRLEWTDENGQLHREDGPARIWPEGTQEWWFEGLPHREGGPAVTYPNGGYKWFRHGCLHRKDGPAVVRESGYQAFYKDGDIVHFLTREGYTREVPGFNKAIFRLVDHRLDDPPKRYRDFLAGLEE